MTHPYTKLFVLFFMTTLSTSAWAQRLGDACTTDSQCSTQLICQQNNCLTDGKVKVTLSWTTNTDLDLHVQTPGGEEISPNIDDEQEAEGGRIVLDQCYGTTCEDHDRSDNHPHVEHVVWETTVVSGRYRVWAENFDGTEAAAFAIVFEKPSGEREFQFGSVGAVKGEVSDVFEFEIDGDTECEKDTDGDGLCDEWETDGIDVDGDGTIDLDLKALGADPKHKDLFIEVDWMKGHAPYPLGKVTTAFANADVTNPDGKKGITLHIQRDEEITKIGSTAVTTTSKLDLSNINKIKFGSKSFACGSGVWFGSKADRDSDNCENISKARQKVFRYGVFGHSQTGTGSSGRGELPGNDFIMTTGGWAGNKQSYEDATFMHELGHTLGIGHGGIDHHNCKPNYLSIMSYLYQFDGFYAGRPYTYSTQALPTISESLLQETDGITGSSSWTTVVYGTGGAGSDPVGEVQFGGAANGAQDWDGDGADNGKDIAAEISHVKSGSQTICGSTSQEFLRGAEDWNNLVYNFRHAGAYEGSGLGEMTDEEEPEEELTEEQVEAMEESADTDGDGFSNREDVCPADVDPAQEDTDGDGVGDVCDACPSDSAPGFSDGCPLAEGQDPDAPTDTSDDSDDDDDDRDDEKDDSIDNDSSGDEELLDAKRGCSTTGDNDPSSMLLFGFLMMVVARRRRRR